MAAGASEQRAPILAFQGLREKDKPLPSYLRGCQSKHNNGTHPYNVNGKGIVLGRELEWRIAVGCTARTWLVLMMEVIHQDSKSRVKVELM